MGGSSSFGVGRDANKSALSKLAILQNILQGLGFGGMGRMDWIDVALDTDRWRAVVTTVMNFQVP